MSRDELFYRMIFKRKSFHLFRDTGADTISEEELNDIKEKFNTFEPLVEGIKTELKIVPAEETTCKRGQEYCLLLYSEKADNYLQNIGYIGEQLDLYLASMNIGTLWFGFGKTTEITHNGLEFIIMIAMKKVPEDKFRKDMYKSKRKSLEDILSGTHYQNVVNIARFTPSSCNTQPWKVESSQDTIHVYRYKETGKRGMMPIHRVTYSNRIDIGIFLLFLELCLKHEKIGFERVLYSDSVEGDETEMTLMAMYKIV